MNHIQIISATRLSEKEFWETTALGNSLKRLTYDSVIVPKITFNNHMGLPHIYNKGIDETSHENYLVFIHDDVWIDDYHFSRRIIEGLNVFNIIGVAGNKRRVAQQPAWAFIDTKFTWDQKSNLSGSVAHGKHPFGNISFFGPTSESCLLLDGVFLATKKETLMRDHIQFDTQFDFHLYDMDFCRSAEKNKLSMGTWPIALTHQSGGHFGTEVWQKSYLAYLKKWGD